jgi:hypothetical protein
MVAMAKRGSPVRGWRPACGVGAALIVSMALLAGGGAGRVPARP